VWCPGCHKTLSAEYGTPWEAVFAWVHGTAGLPPECPFCKMPPEIHDPASETPTVSCRLGQHCPTEGRRILLEKWNQSRPSLFYINRLLKRWKTRPQMRNALRALLRAANHDKRGRWL